MTTTAPSVNGGDVPSEHSFPFLKLIFDIIEIGIELMRNIGFKIVGRLDGVPAIHDSVAYAQ